MNRTDQQSRQPAAPATAQGPNQGITGVHHTTILDELPLLTLWLMICNAALSITYRPLPRSSSSPFTPFRIISRSQFNVWYRINSQQTHQTPFFNQRRDLNICCELNI